MNAVFIPALRQVSIEQKAHWIGWFFPRLFRTVTIAGFVILVVGLLSGLHGNMATLLSRVSFVMIVFLFVFHLIVERKLRPRALAFRSKHTTDDISGFYGYLRVVPRFGLLVITTAFVFQLM